VPPDEPTVTVPDDARDLDRDVRALERERRVARRRRRWRATRRLLPSDDWQAYGLRGPFAFGVLLLVVTAALVPLLLRWGADPRPDPRPLAAPAVGPGLVGGLLPDAPVSTPAGATSSRQLSRPGALLIVPLPCDCEEVLRTVSRELAGSARVRLISSGDLDPTGAGVGALRSSAGRDQLAVGVDVRDRLTTAYGGGRPGDGVTLVVVAADGVVVEVLHDLSADARLDDELQLLRQHA
jgi:hypothetical protein